MRYEYITVDTRIRQVEEVLNEYGSIGWRLVCITDGWLTDQKLCVFERPLPEPTPGPIVPKSNRNKKKT